MDSDNDDNPDEPPDDDDPEKPDEESGDPKDPKDPKPSCIDERLVLRAVVKKIYSVVRKVTELESSISNLKQKIEEDKAMIASLETGEMAGQFGGALSRSPNLALRILGMISEAGGAGASLSLLEIKARSAKNKIQLKEWQEELSILRNELKNLEVEEAAAKEKLKKCLSG